MVLLKMVSRWRMWFRKLETPLSCHAQLEFSGYSIGVGGMFGNGSFGVVHIMSFWVYIDPLYKYHV